MVTITASYTVIPNESIPQGRLWLSDLDQVFRLHRTPLIFVYEAKVNHDDAIQRLRNSLSKILVHYYPMAGRLCFTEGGSRVELELNSKGAILLEAETTKTVSDYGDFSPSESIKELVPTIDSNQPVEEIPLLAVQLTRFQNNEGFAIGVSFYHGLSDGVGFFRFFNSWAKIARGETLEPHETPFLDRTILKFSNPPNEQPRFDHIELKPLPLILGRSDTTVERNKKITAELLKLTAEQVEVLKKKANGSYTRKGSNSRPYSRYEAIAAHTWRCVSKARELQENQPSVVRFNVEIRNRIIPPLPKNYFGNALIQTATKGYIGEITSKPLGYVAEKIREASEVVSDEYLRSQIDVIRGTNADKKSMNAQFCGNPNLHLTSWMSLPMYEGDFGWGKPVYFGLGYVSPHDRGLILLSPDGDGSVVVCMYFQEAHMQLFKKFFYEDIYEMFRSSRL